jgi:hypothetical protein
MSDPRTLNIIYTLLLSNVLWLSAAALAGLQSSVVALGFGFWVALGIRYVVRSYKDYQTSMSIGKQILFALLIPFWPVVVGFALSVGKTQDSDHDSDQNQE